MSIPSVLVLLVMALAGVMSPARSTSQRSHAPTTRSSIATSPSRQTIRSDATHEAGWRHAVRADAARPVRQLASQRHGHADGRERATSSTPVWIPLSLASRTVGHVARERAQGARSPAQRAPSSRAPPLA
ncbi:MAG TPA: hypothetical protein VGP25_10210 [Gemmatimonadaceae bacterium]|jgi:hypothetical protein|nr:hypothetical protein [Gemmatimonadaceae bacterium]